jgi:nucleoid DNA-binding protein
MGKEEFNFSDAVDAVAEETGLHKNQVEKTLQASLAQVANNLAERRAVEFKSHFSLILKSRAPRTGVFKGKAWTTPERLELVVNPSQHLREKLTQAVGMEVI